MPSCGSGATYSVLIKRSAEKEIARLPLVLRRRVIDRIAGLAEEPRPPGCAKLSGQDKYRLRQGAYRIVYTIDDDIVTVVVVRVAHRSDAYR